MPVPLVPVIAALAAGGSLVPHAAGGLIVNAAAGGYVAGTYLSTSAVTAVLATATGTLGATALWATGAASAVIGSAGIFGTTIGATGITGVLMTAGILPSTPIAVPIAIAGASTLVIGSVVYLYRLRSKLASATAGQEIQFTDREAKVIESIVRVFSKKREPKTSS